MKKIAELNDRSRRNLLSVNGSILGVLVLTPGVGSLELSVRHRLFSLISQVKEFHLDNDPYGEHDFGKATMEDGVDFFWKFDYYDIDLEYGSPDPANPEVTTRVLAIMLTSEY